MRAALLPILATLAAVQGHAHGGVAVDTDPLTKAAILEEDRPVPWAGWSAGVDVGALWRVTDNTSQDYFLAPAVLSLRGPAHLEWEFAGGTLVTRARINLLGELIADGPESYYLGWSASPSIEYWFPGEHSSLFFSIGGGSGWIDSNPDVDGAQGRDYTYNWFMHGGLRQRIGDRADLSVGFFFQHFSNRGATDPNPGLDALGPMVGLSWDF